MRKYLKKIIIGFLYFFYIISIATPKVIERGIFLWPSTICEYGDSTILQTLKKHNIKNIFLLVKGESGATLFPSEFTYADFYKNLSHRQTEKQQMYKKLSVFFKDFKLENFIKKAHKKKIKIHGWFMVSADNNFIKKNPGSEAIHLQKPSILPFPYPQPLKKHVNLSYPPYLHHFLSLIKKSMQYDFDGLMLDKIRYTHLVYSWDNIIISEALRKKIDIKKVNSIAFKTLYGGEDNREDIIYKYRDGDKDVKGWVELKKGIVETYVKEVKKIIGKKHILSAAFMPEGAYDEKFADVYYGQNYRNLTQYLDFLVIMAYPKSFKKQPTWIKMVVENAKLRSHSKVWVAIQGYDNVSGKYIEQEIINARIVKPDGIAVFRYGGLDGKWSNLQKGLHTDISKIKKEQIKGIIFKGKGTIRNCWINTANSLLKSNKFIPLLVDSSYLKEKINKQKLKFIIIPGGGGASIANALGEDGLKSIENFVRKGGGYIGICAGSFLPVKGYWNNLTNKLEIVNAEPIDVEHWNRGSGFVKVKIMKNHFIFGKHKKGDILTLKYFSGPILKPSTLHLPRYKELAIFLTDIHKNGAKKGDMLGKTAILESKYKKGHIILFSPHPELTEGFEWLLQNAVIYVSGKIDD